MTIRLSLLLNLSDATVIAIVRSLGAKCSSVRSMIPGMLGDCDALRQLVKNAVDVAAARGASRRREKRLPSPQRGAKRHHGPARNGDGTVPGMPVNATARSGRHANNARV
jgi:hypothetical protein